LDFYRRGGLHICEQNCALIVQSDFDYWGLDDVHLQPCCINKYYPHTESARHEIEEEVNERVEAEQKGMDEKFGSRPIDKLRSVLWDLVEYPETSRVA